LSVDWCATTEDDDIPRTPVTLGVGTHLAECAHRGLVGVIETDRVEPARSSGSQYVGVLSWPALRPRQKDQQLASLVDRGGRINRDVRRFTGRRYGRDAAVRCCRVDLTLDRGRGRHCECGCIARY